MKILPFAFLCLAAVACSKPGGGASKFPGTEEGARALLGEFLKSGTDKAALSKDLRPADADYDAVFMPELANKAKTEYAKVWDSGNLVISGKPEQTQLKLWSATSDDLKAWNEKAKEFPGGYQRVAALVKPGHTWYRFKFVKPADDLGMAYDGLVHVNGRWAIFPKPYRMVPADAPQ